jgi:hypothetical protein
MIPAEDQEMRFTFKPITVLALASALAGCSNESPPAQQASAAKGAAAPAKAGAPAAGYAQVVVEVPGMT